jgi:ATP/maltotriose-dependent transcriptional regulator MalT
VGCPDDHDRHRDGQADLPGPVVSIALEEADARADSPHRARQGPIPHATEISDREIAVLRLMAGGLSQREIGTTLFISFNTVKTHSKSIFRKLGVATRAEAVARARELRLIR